MADRMKPPFLGKAPDSGRFLSDKDLKALMENKSSSRGGRVPSVSDQDLERLRKLMEKKKKQLSPPIMPDEARRIRSMVNKDRTAPLQQMKYGGAVKKMKHGGCVMSGRGGSFKGIK